MRKMEEEDEYDAHSHNDLDSVRNLKMRVEERSLRLRQIMDVIPVVMEEDEHDAHSPGEVDSVKIKTERLPLMLTEEAVGH
jgi:hypothetical protein